MHIASIPGGSLLAIIRRDWKTPPNLVTTARMVGTLGLPRLIVSTDRKERTAAAIAFIVLAATDKLDGWMAKRFGWVTELGKMLDPLVDKELVLVTLLSSLEGARRRKDYPLVASLGGAIAILSVREIAVARIKMRAQRQGGKVESAIQSGRVSMVAQSVAVGALLVPSESKRAKRVKLGLLAVAVGASLYSWYDYSKRY